MPEPVHINRPYILIDSGDRLNPGDVVSVRIGEALPDGRLTILVGGRTLHARSHLNLLPDTRIRAVVEQRDSGVVLRLVGRDPSRGPSGPASEPVTARLSAAILRSGMALPPDGELARRAALLGRTKGREIRMARLYAEVLAKGADPTAGFLEALDALLGNGDGGSGRKDGRRSRVWNSPPQENKLKEVLDSGQDETQPVLDLLNSTGGHREKWMFIRKEFQICERNYQTIWKIRGGSSPALALTVFDRGRVLEFLIEGTGQPFMQVYSDRPERISPDRWSSFRERLALMNFSVDDTILPIDLSDGFTPDERGKGSE